MKKLVKLQLRNLFSLKSFYICSGLMLLTPIITLLFTVLMKKPYNAKFIPEVSSLLSSTEILITVVIVLFVCLDSSDGTLKNIISRGYTKKQYLLSKYIVALITTVIMYLIPIVFTFILTIGNGMGFESKYVYYIFAYLLQIGATICLYVVLSYIFEKIGPSMVACLIGPSMVGTALPLLQLLVKTKKINIANFWITNIAGSAIVKHPDILDLLVVVVLAAVYIMGLLLLGIYIGKKKEVK